MSKENKEITMEIVDGFDHIIAEYGNSSLNLRKVSWNGREAKLDLRKWQYSDTGERACKGVTMNDNETSELAGVLVEEGYGDTKRIIKAIQKREDYQYYIDNLDDIDEEVEDDGSEEYYDPSELFE